jgi:glycosyltransferase involved in cell wall biosynthesis
VFLPAAVEKHKNIEVLIDGMARIADRELELWIAGRSTHDPGHREVLQRRAESAGVGRRVRFLGAVPYADLLSYYRHAEAFAFPSTIETFGLPLLEALAAGTPTLASDIPVFREIAGDAALYFAPDDPSAVARSIDALQSDQEATRRRVEIGRTRSAGFTWRASADALCAVFSEVIRPARQVRPEGELRL